MFSKLRREKGPSKVDSPAPSDTGQQVGASASKYDKTKTTEDETLIETDRDQ